jgi:hypothetical protein
MAMASDTGAMNPSLTLSVAEQRIGELKAQVTRARARRPSDSTESNRHVFPRAVRRLTTRLRVVGELKVSTNEPRR